MQYTRKVYAGPELVKDERYTVRYDAQNAIVEVGTKKVKPKPPRVAAKPKTPPPDDDDAAVPPPESG